MVDRSVYTFILFLCVCSTIIFIDLYISDPFTGSSLVVPHPRKDYNMYLQLRHIPRPQKTFKGLRKVNLTIFHNLMPDDNHYDLIPGKTGKKQKQSFGSMMKSVGESDWTWSSMNAMSWLGAPELIGKTKLSQISPKRGNHPDNELPELTEQDYLFLQQFQNIDTSSNYQENEQPEIQGNGFSFMNNLQENNERPKISGRHQQEYNSFANKLHETFGVPQGRPQAREQNEVPLELSADVVTDLFKVFVKRQNENAKFRDTASGATSKRLFALKRRYELRNRTDIPEKLYRLAPQVFDSVPSASEFLKNYKSPCWRRSTSDSDDVQCLPYFYIAGMPKCGTTDIWAKVNSHKGIFQTRKEPHWWARFRLSGEPGDGRGRKSLKWYLHRFSGMTNSTLLNIVNDRSGSRSSPFTNIAGDGSASTLWDDTKWEFFYPEYYKQGPPYTLADIIHAVTPDVKIIVTLRDPIERLYSEYRYFWRKPTNKKFHQLVLNDVANLYKCLQNRSLRACTYQSNGRNHKENKIGLAKGFYDVYMRDWLQSFPREQLTVLRMEDWSAYCPDIIAQIFKLLGVAPLTTKSTQELCSRKTARNKGRVKMGDMLPETKQLLQYIYKPHLHSLADILNNTKWHWSETFR